MNPRPAEPGPVHASDPAPFFPMSALMLPSISRPSRACGRLQRLASVRIVLSHPSHPGNIGAAARAMKTMGLSQLALVNPEHFPDTVATARAAGADDVLRACRVCASLDEALHGTVLAVALSARPRDLGPAPLPVRDAVSLILAQAAFGDVALVFGNETRGLPNEAVQRCRHIVRIPADPAYSSLNLGAAVQVLCYELRQCALSDAPPNASPMAGRVTPFASPPATHEEVEGFYAHLRDVMIRAGFHDPQRPKRLMPKLRRLFGRAALERDEINILRGILDAVDQRDRRP